MFLRKSPRKKDGKTHDYLSVVENKRVAGGRVVQRHVLYLGEIKSSQDGSVIHPIYLYQVKSPEESEGEWDYFKLVATLPGEEAFGPMNQACPLVPR
jgi:hypothetical protein